MDTARIFLHIISICGWVGGQLLMVSLLPVLRKISPEAPRLAADRFGRFAWAFLFLALITGVWSVFEIELSSKDSAYQITLFIKLLLVAASGISALIHSRTKSVPVRAATGALGLLTALGALLSGVLLTN
jgi:putative copper export protein